MKRQILTIITISLFFLSCTTGANSDNSETIGNKDNSDTIKSFEYKDSHLTVTRTIAQTSTDEYKVVIKINSAEQLEGYVTVEDKFENSMESKDSTKWKYVPYFSSDKEIRFVFSDPNKTKGLATPIPNNKSFQVDYIVKVKDKRKLKIDGTIMYLEKHGTNLITVPELITSADF
jgi:hypothetical protein